MQKFLIFLLFPMFVESDPIKDSTLTAKKGVCSSFQNPFLPPDPKIGYHRKMFSLSRKV